jgi:hypothetical protein
MSRAQSFTSMAAWPKSEPCEIRYFAVSKMEKGFKAMASLQSRLDKFKNAFERAKVL